jgi:hypothetical protein
MTVRRIAFLAVVLVAGCSKIHDQRSFTVDMNGSHNLQISAPLSQQTVKIVLTSDEPVNIWVILEKNVPGGKDEFDPETIKDGILAKEKDTKEATLTATIPGKEAYRIYVDGAKKKANVTVKIDSQ